MNYKEEIDEILKSYSEEGDCHMYTKSCYESALKAYQSLEADGHSGMSWGITAKILTRMINDLPLMPITEQDEFTPWGFDNKVEFSNRYSALSRTKNEDGTYSYSDIHRYTTSNGFSSGFGNKVLNELFPITLPYFPSVQKFHIKVEDFDTHGKVGCFDTYAVWSIRTPEGETVQVNKFFKEENGSWVEISKEEFEDRKKMYLNSIKKN